MSEYKRNRNGKDRAEDANAEQSNEKDSKEGVNTIRSYLKDLSMKTILEKNMDRSHSCENNLNENNLNEKNLTAKKKHANDRLDLSVSIAGTTFRNPVMTASGTFGSGMEYNDFVDLNKLGAVVTKGVASVPWPGNPTPRVAETYGGMLNAIGLQNPGIDVFIKRDLAFLNQYDTRVIVNVCGKTVEDYLTVVERLVDTDVDMLEINVSCPNVKEGAIAFGQKADSLFDITRQIKAKAKQPIIMKLSPNVTDITEMAKAAEAGGADAISLINTLTGMQIDIHRRIFTLANKTGGLSGPAIKPIAVRMVYQVSHAVHIPVIGMGGIANASDAIEFMLAGATAIAAGAMNFVTPTLTEDIITGMEEYMNQYGIKDIKELIGSI